MKGDRDISGPAGRPTLWGASAWVCLMFLAAPAFGGAADDRLRQDYLRLKTRFELLARRNSDPAALACLSVETTALTWALAAAQLAEDRESQTGWRNRADEFEKSWSSSRDWDRRHRRALKVYYEALEAVGRALAAESGHTLLAAEVRAITARVARETAALGERPDASLEKLVFSDGLFDLAAAITRALGRGSLDRPADLIAQDVDEEAETIRGRGDLHYRAKLAYLYAAHVQGLTDLVFLWGRPAGPPLSQNLEEIHLALNKVGGDRRLPTTLSLAWIAQTQACLPLAHWLVTRPRPAPRLSP